MSDEPGEGRDADKANTTNQRVMPIVTMVGLLCLSGVAAYAAFFCGCWAGITARDVSLERKGSSYLIVLSYIAGALAALIVMIGLIRVTYLTWPRKR